MKIELTADERKQILAAGFEMNAIQAQIDKFRRGISYAKLIKPAGKGEGIQIFEENESKNLLTVFEREKVNHQIVKFVPASGAASRMFKDLMGYFNHAEAQHSEFIDQFIDGMKSEKFAFIPDLRAILSQAGEKLEKLLEEGKIRTILNYLLTDAGLNYSQLPKAVLAFHWGDGKARTPIEAHIDEGIAYAEGKNGQVNIHFTISPQFENHFSEMIKQALATKDGLADHITITWSYQKEETQTVAVKPDNQLFKLPNGKILFRPGGHGALIENLNDLEADIIYIKNIDNVVVHDKSDDVNRYKRILGGYLFEVKERVFAYLERLALGADRLSDQALEEIVTFCAAIHVEFQPDFQQLPKTDRIERLKERLNRPIRVCGMVKNEGEPGGGPFWIDLNNRPSLQIIESAAVDFSDPKQADIFKRAGFFNPVDLVCSVRNFRGEKFDLTRYIDPDAYFISEKSHEGMQLKALELPGLWNGAMADWITLFVEVPLMTFNPVKTVNDLLKPNHQTIPVE